MNKNVINYYMGFCNDEETNNIYYSKPETSFTLIPIINKVNQQPVKKTIILSAEIGTEKTIRIHHEFEGMINKPIPRITV